MATKMDKDLLTGCDRSEWSPAPRPSQRLARTDAATALLATTQRIPHEPEHGRPKTHEQSSALSVLTLVFADGLRTDPEDDAKQDCDQRERVEVTTAHGQLGGIKTRHR